MKKLIVKLTYVADVDDEIGVDYIHEKLDDCIDREFSIDIDSDDEDSSHVLLGLQEWQTKVGDDSLLTIPL